MERSLSYSTSSQYGWAGKTPETLAKELKHALTVFGRLRKKVQFDAIAFTGSSGAAIAFNIATKFGIPLIYVRKKSEISHGVKVECNGGGGDNFIKSYMIVDDFICSGHTITTIINSITDYTQTRDIHSPTPVGVFCFDDCTVNGHTRDFGKTTLPVYTTLPRRQK